MQTSLLGTATKGLVEPSCGSECLRRARCGKTARRDLRGGCQATDSPTAIGIFLGATVVTGNEQFPQQNKIQGNRIGIKAFSYEVLPNKKGIYVQNAADNFIGPDSTSDCGPNTSDQLACLDFGNIIGGSEADAIHVDGSTTTNHLLANNYVGVAPDGTAIGNGANGILIDVGSAATSPAIQVQDNTIGNNIGDGIKVTPGSAPQSPQKARGPGGTPPPVQISGNRIGVLKDATGQTHPMPNDGNGITLDCVQNILIGYQQALGLISNIISANRGMGIQVARAIQFAPMAPGPCPGSGNNVINSSIIGTDESGTPNLGNGGDGIKIIDSSGNLIGSGGLGNIISGNQGSGVSIEGPTSNENTLLGNSIGVVVNATAAISVPNGENGVNISGAGQTTIGGFADNESNIIAANNQMGILLDGVNAQLNTIRNTQIGVIRALSFRPQGSAPNLPGDFGNGSHGILLTNGARLNTIGGPQTNAGNTIAFNRGAGVRVDDTAGDSNMIDPNSIHSNAGLGIDLGPSDLTLNDPGDGDTGPNRLQNFPEFLSASIDTSGNLIINYMVDSAPGSSNYGTSGLYIELFEADANLQGKTFVSSTHYTASDYGNGTPGIAVFNAGNAASLGVANGDKLVATATDVDNNTSEFTSTNVGVVGGSTCPSITVSPSSLSAGTVDSSYNQAVSASGGTGPYTFAVTSGALPPGLVLNSAAEISGTPTTANGSPFNFTVTATDANNCTGTQNYSVAINCPTITLSTSSLPSGTVGQSYNHNITAGGTPGPFTFTVTNGTLPTSLTLSATGELSGTPTQSGTFNFTLTATDANAGCSGSQSYSVTINCPTITVNPATLPDATVGQSYNQTVTAGGTSGPFAFVVTSGSLPTGLTIDSGTGQISGTPTTTSGSPFGFTITATNSASGCVGSRGYSITVNATPAPVIVEGGISITSESCPPNNNVVDPGERVSLNLRLMNNGNASTSNLVATLQSSANVIVPSGQQTYGALAPGNSVSRPFTFTADGAPGATIPVTLQLQNGATNLGTATFNITLGSDSSCRIPRLILTSTLQRINATTVKAIYSVQNAGAVTANNVQLTASKLGAAIGTPVPQSLGSIAPGATSSPMEMLFTNSTPGATSSLTLSGTYSGGSFSTIKRVTVP